jgi:hypothetical protein
MPHLGHEEKVAAVADQGQQLAIRAPGHAGNTSLDAANLLQLLCLCIDEQQVP